MIWLYRSFFHQFFAPFTASCQPYMPLICLDKGVQIKFLIINRISKRSIKKVTEKGWNQKNVYHRGKRAVKSGPFILVVSPSLSVYYAVYVSTSHYSHKHHRIYGHAVIPLTSVTITVNAQVTESCHPLLC